MKESEKIVEVLSTLDKDQLLKILGIVPAWMVFDACLKLSIKHKQLDQYVRKFRIAQLKRDNRYAKKVIANTQKWIDDLKSGRPITKEDL